MSDQGFDFQRKPDRREKPSFEIPPWERQAFEELQKRKGEGAERPPAREGDGFPGDEGVLQAPASQPETVQPVAGASPEPNEDEQVNAKASMSKDPETKAGPSEAVLLELLAGLAEEEPNLGKHFAGISLAVAMVLGPFGLVLIVWGMAAVAKAEAVGSAALVRTAGAGLVVFGAAFVAGAFWTVYKVMKQRGVL